MVAGVARALRRKLASKHPERYRVDSLGWVAMSLDGGDAPPPGLLERWVDESYRAVAHKELVAALDGQAARRKKVGRKA